MSSKTGPGTSSEKVSGIARSFSLDLVFLFGSQREKGLCVLRGETVNTRDPLADLDVGVVFPTGAFPDRPFKVFGPLYAEFQEVFRPLKLDLVFLQETESTFQFEAIQGACVYCSDQETLENYVERVLKFASDWKFTREKINQEFLMRT